MTIALPIYQVDAFASAPFTGNPAAVMPLQAWLPDALMQNIAAENNLAETVFFVATPDAAEDFHIRWFTPEKEIALCGHATLASADIIWRHLGFAKPVLTLATQTAGTLTVVRDADRYALNFPAYISAPYETDAAFDAAMGKKPRAAFEYQGYVLAVYDTEQDVAALAPDFSAVRKLGLEVIATARGDPARTETIDFVSRFFAPCVGIDEDPVTGSAHCRLVPYWANVLGKNILRARQISRRGGDLWCELQGDRVIMAGYCVEVMRGTFFA
jgi:PhzF family phenazine biosynthesis protein